LLEKGVIKLSSDFISPQALEKETSRILLLANSAFSAKEKINLIHKGEASCLAFSNLCNCQNVIAVDERTARMLSESPEGLRQIMESKLHMKISIDKKILSQLGKFNFIRSTEILFIAYKKKIFEYPHDKNLLDALLYAVKYNGVAVSSREIEEMKRLA
jgi:predicted nucleic acid-binding protein